MLRKIILAAAILILCVSALLVYINKVIIPVKIRSLVISGLESATGRQVDAGVISFNLLKGVVIRDIAISEDKSPVIQIQEASCAFSLFPLLARKLVISSIRIDSPVINLIRFKDKSLNLSDIFSIKEGQTQKGAFRVSVNNIAVRSGKVNFTDNAVSPVFRSSLDNINLNVYFALPAKVKFNLKARVGKSQKSEIRSQGEFNIPSQQLNATVDINDLALNEYSVYLGSQFALPKNASIDSSIKLNYKKDALKLDIDASVLNLPVKGQVIIQDLKNPVAKANLTSSFELGAIQKIAKDNFALIIPATVSGAGNLSLAYESALSEGANSKFSGYLDIGKAILKLDSLDSPVTDISGRINILQDGISWSDFNGSFKDLSYKLSGSLTDFKTPNVQLTLSSRDLSLDAGFVLIGKVLNPLICSGNYLNSGFSLKGRLDFSEKNRLESDINGAIKFNLADIKALLKNPSDKIDMMKLAGIANLKFNLTGNLSDLKSCSVDGSLSSYTLSAYGLHSGNINVAYLFSNNLLDIPVMRMELYDGVVEGAMKINFNSKNMPYIINASCEGVKIEKLKNDAQAKDKDIAGTIKGEVKLNGFSDDLSKLTGSGKIFITEGKLWQLNLLQGLGSIMLGDDFAKVVFSEASCAFAVRDQFIYSDNLSMKGNIADMNGSLRLGFDSSIEANLNVEILAGEAPLKGTFKDVTTAILGRSGRFGVITINGTLKDPKFKFQPAVTDIIQGLADTFLKRQ